MIAFIIENLIKLLGPMTNLSKEQRELKDQALNLISDALNSTYIYFQKREREGKPKLTTKERLLRNEQNQMIEEELSKKWRAAAIPIRHFDQRLAQICDQKADYWVNPDNWKAEGIAEADTELDAVRKRYRELLHPDVT